MLITAERDGHFGLRAKPAPRLIGGCRAAPVNPTSNLYSVRFTFLRFSFTVSTTYAEPRQLLFYRVSNALQVLLQAVGKGSVFGTGVFAQVDADDSASRFANEVFCVCGVSGVQ